MATSQTNNSNGVVNLPATSRTRERPAGDEEADVQLSLGEFTNVPTLSLSEARVIINAVVEGRRGVNGMTKGGFGPIEETENFTKTQDYLDMFARFKRKENIEAVERLLGSRTELAAFERSQLATLCLGDGEEAISLIPSLSNKMTKAELDELTRDIANLRNLVEGP